MNVVSLFGTLPETHFSKESRFELVLCSYSNHFLPLRVKDLQNAAWVPVSRYGHCISSQGVILFPKKNRALRTSDSNFLSGVNVSISPIPSFFLMTSICRILSLRLGTRMLPFWNKSQKSSKKIKETCTYSSIYLTYYVVDFPGLSNLPRYWSVKSSLFGIFFAVCVSGRNHLSTSWQANDSKDLTFSNGSR